MRFSLTLIALIALASPLAADETVVHPLSTSVACGGVRRMIVDIPAGEIAVRNGPAGRIRVSGEARREYSDYRSRDKQQRIVDDISMEIFVNGRDALVRRSFGPNARSWTAQHWRTNYRVTVEVPPGMDVDIETSAGELSIDGDFGNVDADLRAGEIALRMPRAAVHELSASVRIGEVHTDFGDDSEDHEGVFPGSTHFFNAGGRSRVNVHTTVGELRVTLTK